MSVGRSAAAAAVLALALAACGGETRAPSGGDGGRGTADANTASPWALSAGPGGAAGRCAPGTHSLATGGRKALLRVTRGGSGSRALILSLQGAGGSAKGALWIFRAAWDEPGVAILAPAAAGSTWDLRDAGDVAFVNRALARTFARCPIDPRRIAVGGFSDGATMALTLGLPNGDLFDAIMALSPGGILSEERIGEPRIFVAHGRRDDVIPIDRGGGRLVPELRRAGYAVTYRTFAGGHKVPEQVSEAAVRWFLRG
jgi:phospholipase/carboxylesterase